MKTGVIIFIFSFFWCYGFAQGDTLHGKRKETIIPVQSNIQEGQINETLSDRNNLMPALKLPPKKKRAVIHVDSARLRDSLASLAIRTTTDSLKSLANADSVRRDSLFRDSLKQEADLKEKAAEKLKDTSTYYAVLAIPSLPFGKPPVFMVTKEMPDQSKDELFYLLTGLVMLVALLRLIFPKYFENLLLLIFQTNFRQKQTREQLLQDNLASLMMNALFFITASIYISLLINSNNFTGLSFWELLGGCFVGLTAIYACKYVALRFTGWVFNVKSATDTYIFIVFMVNKIAGILLIPVILFLSFARMDIRGKIVTGTFIFIGFLLLYRYLISLRAIRQDLKVNALHFFLYLCAVEVLPMLLIFKVLIDHIGNYI